MARRRTCAERSVPESEQPGCDGKSVGGEQQRMGGGRDLPGVPACRLPGPSRGSCQAGRKHE
jgi:hypothetical protein